MEITEFVLKFGPGAVELCSMEESNNRSSPAAAIEGARVPGSSEVRIVVRGRLDFGGVLAFRAAYEADPHASRYVVDLTAADAMTGSAMGMLLNLRAFAQRVGATVAVTGFDDDFRELLELSRLAEAFDCGARVG